VIHFKVPKDEAFNVIKIYICILITKTCTVEIVLLNQPQRIANWMKSADVKLFCECG
jgi:hypothetical protein